MRRFGKNRTGKAETANQNHQQAPENRQDPPPAGTKRLGKSIHYRSLRAIFRPGKKQKENHRIRPAAVKLPKPQNQKSGKKIPEANRYELTSKCFKEKCVGYLSPVEINNIFGWFNDVYRGVCFAKRDLKTSSNFVVRLSSAWT